MSGFGESIRAGTMGHKWGKETNILRTIVDSLGKTVLCHDGEISKTVASQRPEKTPPIKKHAGHGYVTTRLTRLTNIEELCKIWYFHGSDYEECRLLGCYDVWLFAACIGCQLLSTLFLARRFFHPDDEDDTFLRNVGYYKNHMA
jgi:hypothetical protein